MKKIYIIISLALFAMSCNFNPGHQSIKIKKTDNTYLFEASYPTRKTKSVINYIEETLNDDRLFNNVGEQKNGEVNLDNNLRFYLNAKPGYIEIKFMKTRNSEAGFNKLENLCLGIRDELKE